MSTILFKEVQYFRQNPVWVLLLVVPVGVMSAILIYQLVTGQIVGDLPVSNMALMLLIALVIVPALLAIFRIKLTTIIDEEKISYGWNMPTPELNVIRLTDIKEWSVIKYDFVGYGYRSSEKYGTVHNLSGNRGIFILTKDGEKILIGTHRLRDLRAVMEKLSNVVPQGQE